MEWLSLIHECRLSGLTDKQWCEAHQICPSNFYYQIQKFRKRACEIPESHSKTTLTAQKQEVVQVTFEQPAVSEHPQSCLSKDAKADAAILLQINGFQIGITARYRVPDPRYYLSCESFGHSLKVMFKQWVAVCLPFLII